MDRFSNILKQRLEAMQSAQAAHPSSDTLVAFIERGLTGSQRENVLGHLSACPECREAISLATPEAATVNAQAATSSTSRALHFPAAMRWASLAAALAVAVGVGVIAYEHEPRQQVATLSAPLERTSSPAVSATTAKKDVASNSSQSTNGKSAAQTAATRPAVPKLEVRRERTLAKKETGAKGAILGALSTPPANLEIKDRNELRFKALPAAPEAQSQLADKRDAVPLMQAIPASPSARASSVTAESNAVQEVDNDITAAKPGASSANGGVVGGSAGTALVAAQPTPAKAFTAASVSGSGTKAKLAYGVLGFVHWTISAAGKLQRRAVDGTLTIVEPVRGAIIRAVAAEGIEVWAGGSQSPPSPKNVHPRSLLFHSSDAGESWSAIDGPWQGSIERVNLAGLNSLTVVTTDGTWNTGDGGKSWSKP